MPKIDQFESVFRAASRTPYAYEHVAVKKVLVVTDLDAEGAERFTETIQTFLGNAVQGAQWKTVAGVGYSDVGDLIDMVEEQNPDLVCSYRNLKSSAWKWPFSLGAEVDVLTQATDVPVLLVPNPHAANQADHALKDTTDVMVVADHLTGDHRIVNYGVRFTQPAGRLHLSHVESLGDFQLYMDAISRIPEVDTPVAQEAIQRILLKQPTDYISSVEERLRAEGLDLTVTHAVEMGHRIESYRHFIGEREVDLLVVNTKHAHQLAMASLAHRLAVEFRSIPILML